MPNTDLNPATVIPATAAKSLPEIPPKRYFTIGEVSELCGVKAHVLRYWEQEFEALAPLKRRGNRRYYQRYEVQLVRHIRELLYDQGFTIAGARSRLELLRNTMPILKQDPTLADERLETSMLSMAGVHTEILNIARMLDPHNRFSEIELPGFADTLTS
jgi:DNA-binding transcriptional MerR regulator